MTQWYCLFETAIGLGALAWSGAGVLGIHLPEPDAARVRRRMRQRFPHAVECSPPDEIQHHIDSMCALLRGEPADLSTIELDMRRVPELAQRVYAVARTIPAGSTLSYGQIASRLGEPHLAREVGQALARNPFPIVVPCHRVVGAHGSLGGFSAAGGVATKQRLLAIEQANVAWQLPLLA